ncbi:MAG: 16S rRNA (guanine(966)-N(2))-methyltransferase RsmD [bacterium]|nr:16S rRNA (guanine(966)-N(2))-methyltransferase RsmD [bacterium]
MRVVGGSLRGRNLIPFKEDKIRPTSDKVKEALFNIIAPYLTEGMLVADFFAGTGNLGIEAISRGAGKAVFVELDRACLAVLQENLERCKIKGRAELVLSDVKKAIARLEAKAYLFDLIFLDPPYGKGLADETMEILGESTIASKALVVVEHSASDHMKESYGRLEIKDMRKYKNTSLSFFKGEID